MYTVFLRSSSVTSTVKELFKSVHVCQRHLKNKSGSLLWLTVYMLYSAYMLRQFHVSVRPSVTVTPVDCIKTAEYIIEILSPSDRAIILVFRHQGSLRESDGFTSNERGHQIQVGCDFRPICGYIS